MGFFMVMAFVLASCMVVSIIRRCGTSDSESDADDENADGAGDDVADGADDDIADNSIMVVCTIPRYCTSLFSRNPWRLSSSSKSTILDIPDIF